MNTSLSFSFRLGWDTLRSRPALTLLAILLLTFGISVVSIMVAARHILSTARGELLAASSVELELAGDNPELYAEVMARVEEWPGVASVSYLSQDQVLAEIEAESGDSLLAVLGANPFPAIVRVQFEAQNIGVMDSLLTVARAWPEVTAAVFPNQIWQDINALADRVNRWLWQGAIPIFIIMLVLVALCLRAQIVNRSATWEFLALLGMSRASLRAVVVTQQALIGIAAGSFTCAFLWLAKQGAEWLLLREVSLPVPFYVLTIVLPLMSAFFAGLASRPTRP